MVWLFPEWADAERYILEFADSLGVYIYRDDKNSTSTNTAISIELLDMDKVVRVVPTKYRACFYKQYSWFKRLILRPDKLEYAQHIICSEIEFHDVSAFQRVANYLEKPLRENPEASAMLFCIAMGVPVYINIVDMSNIPETLVEEFLKYMESDDYLEE